MKLSDYSPRKTFYKSPKHEKAKLNNSLEMQQKKEMQNSRSSSVHNTGIVFFK